MPGQAVLIRKFKPVGLAARVVSFICFLSAFIGCAHLIAYYDPVSYKKLVDFKTETLLLIDNISASPSQLNYVGKLDELKSNLEKASEYEKGRELNDDTIAQFAEIIKMVDGIVLTLKEKQKLSPVYLKEKRLKFEKAFDMAIGTEESKLKKGVQ